MAGGHGIRRRNDSRQPPSRGPGVRICWEPAAWRCWPSSRSCSTITGPITSCHQGVVCLSAGLLHAIPAALASWLLLRRGFAVNPVAAGLVAGTLAGLAGVTMLELHCANLKPPCDALAHRGDPGQRGRGSVAGTVYNVAHDPRSPWFSFRRARAAGAGRGLWRRSRAQDALLCAGAIPTGAGAADSRIHDFFSKALLPALDRVHPGPKIFLEAIAAPHLPLVTAIVGVESVGQIWEISQQLFADKDFSRAFDQWESGAEPYVTSSATLLENLPPRGACPPGVLTLDRFRRQPAEPDLPDSVRQPGRARKGLERVWRRRRMDQGAQGIRGARWPDHRRDRPFAAPRHGVLTAATSLAAFVSTPDFCRKPRSRNQSMKRSCQVPYGVKLR
jgi:hypothetical protein